MKGSNAPVRIESLIFSLKSNIVRDLKEKLNDEKNSHTFNNIDSPQDINPTNLKNLKADNLDDFKEHIRGNKLLKLLQDELKELITSKINEFFNEIGLAELATSNRDLNSLKEKLKDLTNCENKIIKDSAEQLSESLAKIDSSIDKFILKAIVLEGSYQQNKSTLEEKKQIDSNEIFNSLYMSIASVIGCCAVFMSIIAIAPISTLVITLPIVGLLFTAAISTKLLIDYNKLDNDIDKLDTSKNRNLFQNFNELGSYLGQVYNTLIVLKKEIDSENQRQTSASNLDKYLAKDAERKPSNFLTSTKNNVKIEMYGK